MIYLDELHLIYLARHGVCSVVDERLLVCTPTIIAVDSSYELEGRNYVLPHSPRAHLSLAGFGNQFIFGYEVEVELPIQLENGNEVEYE